MNIEKRNLPNCIRIGLGLRPMEALCYKPMAAQIPPGPLNDYIYNMFIPVMEEHLRPFK